MESNLATFLESLFAEGKVRVGVPAEIAERDLAAADAALAECDELLRHDLPGDPPALDRDAARWGAVMLYRACQFVAYRDAGEEQMSVAFAPRCPGSAGPSQHYSVDITFRYLPDLLKLSRSASEGDPLVARIRQWAADWPLSSVGISGIAPGPIDAIAGNRCLLRLYADRVVQRRDLARMADERVRACVSESLGMFTDLAAEVAGNL